MLTAISPVDGRYNNKVKVLENYFSEYALIKYRTIVEVEYFIALCSIPLDQLDGFDHNLFNDLRNIYLYDIDDLKGIIDINKTKRQQEAIKAERIVQEEVIKFEKWLKTLEVVPTIISLRDKAEHIRQAEVRKSLTGLGKLTPSQMNVIERLTSSIAEKIMSDPIIVLKGQTDRGLRDTYLDITRKLFNLDQDNSENEY